MIPITIRRFHASGNVKISHRSIFAEFGEFLSGKRPSWKHGGDKVPRKGEGNPPMP